jgi:hypothetical protein
MMRPADGNAAPAPFPQWAVEIDDAWLLVLTGDMTLATFAEIVAKVAAAERTDGSGEPTRISLRSAKLR